MESARSPRERCSRGHAVIYGSEMRQSKSVASEIRSRIAEMLRCRMSGQINQMLRYFAPNTVVHCASSREGLLPPRTYGRARTASTMTRRTDENYEPLEHEILDILLDGQNAVN